MSSSLSNSVLSKARLPCCLLGSLTGLGVLLGRLVLSSTTV